MGDAARSLVGGKSTVTQRVGRYVGNDGLLALVDLGGQRIPVQFATPWVPEINEPVWVDSVDGVLRLVGPTRPKPGVGVVVTITGSMAVVLTDFGEFAMPVAPSDPMPSSGDTVGISWSSQPWCTLLVDVPDPNVPPPDPSPGVPDLRSAEFRAVDAGSTDRGGARWWTPQVRAGNSTYGAWFYGSQIKDTIPAGAVLEYIGGVPQLEFYVSWQQRSGAAPRFVFHNSPFKAGVPGVSSYVEWAPGGGWQTPPNAQALFEALKAGGAWWGVGLNQGGNNIFSSLAQDGLSGAIRIRWR